MSTRVSDRPGYSRIGLLITHEAREALDKVCAEWSVGQAEVLEAAALFIPKDVVAAGVKQAKAARKNAKGKRLSLKRELSKLSESELAALLATLKVTEQR